MPDKHPKKRIVFALGETVLDLVSEDGLTLRAIPGGSVLNASVSLSRMGIDVQLLSEIGSDKAGDIICDFLKLNEVQTDFCIRHPYHKTSLALAFLDKEKNASYSFYHDSPGHLTKSVIPDFTGHDILLFGSFYAVKLNRRAFITENLKKASSAGSFIYYDLNIRQNHTENIISLMDDYIANMKSANVVKGSDEDFANLFGLTDPKAIYEKVTPYCKNLIITCGANPMHIYTPEYSRTYAIPLITPVSTIGAGDNFNAGFIYGLVTAEYEVNNNLNVSGNEIDRLIGCGLAFATEACLSSENYITGNFDLDFWKMYI